VRLFFQQFLLIADSAGRCLNRITRNGGKNWPVTRWPLSDKLCAVSAVRYLFDERVIVACCEDRKLIELSNHGERIRETFLSSITFTSLWSARALESGGYLVSYRSETVSKVDDSGRVTESYGDWWLPWGRELLRGECCMAVDSDGFVFVADGENNRIVLLNPSLQFVRSITTRCRPRSLHFDRKSQRLFTSDNFSSEVRVLQL